MWKNFCSWLLYKRLGWRKDITVPHPDKYIICLAPHTSNWDFVLGQLYMRAEGMHINFLMKREWFRGPMGRFFRATGGIPVWRDKHTSLTDNLAAESARMKTFHLCITPEGTRSANPDWKLGFYYIALKAQIPILLYGVDYERRLIQCTRMITATGDVEQQMREIKLYYKDFKGKHPENFTIGEMKEGGEGHAE